ncbi:MAG TPA: acyl-CoA thioesterase [Fibrobacteraceae bacterium]|nr:acyl-CoA thioesterase [Fibrobacteraceae bacterium]
MSLNGKPVSASQVESCELVQPGDVNVYGSVFGGHLMSLVDKAAGISAYRHSEMNVVTISVDQVVFKNSAPVGSILSIKASVNRVFNTSMEIGVIVTGWRPGAKDPALICPAYLTFVALGPNGEPAPILPVIPETPDQIRRYEHAGLRREARLALAAKIKEHGGV